MLSEMLKIEKKVSFFEEGHPLALNEQHSAKKRRQRGSVVLTSSSLAGQRTKKSTAGR
jgi:hypothetical protein